MARGEPETRRDAGEDGPDGERRQRGETPLVEWIAAGISTVLVLAMLGYMVREALVGRDGPPELSVRPDSVVRAGHGYLVMFTVRNQGGETAAGATVLGELLRGDSTLEESESTIDYVPVDGARSGGLLFSHDPARDSLDIRVGGFQLP